jgi:hypothetical protein
MDNAQIIKNKIKRRKWGFGILGTLILYYLIISFFVEKAFSINRWEHIYIFIFILLLLTSVILIFNFARILFDPQEYTPNNTREKIVEKLRYRGILFNNIAIILFILNLVVIFVCFYLLLDPSITSSTGDGKDWLNSLTVRIGSSILLIFLVQILFKVFKYLLRVAAFYNARADAIEFILIDISSEPKIGLDKFMDLFTPDKYDIAELEKVSLFEGMSDFIKAKSLGK